MKQPFSIPHHLRPAAIRTHLVTGAPGSGKSTFVKQHSRPDDVVIDFDLIRASLGDDPYSDDAQTLRRAFKIRDRLLHSLAHRAMGQEAWFVTTAPTREEELAWLSALGPMASLTRMDTPAAVCHFRIDQDLRRRNYRQVLHRKVDEYFFARRSSA
jgi:predicted kinase